MSKLIGISMKASAKFFIVLACIPVLLLIFYASNIYGYVRFKSYCSNEGGLQVYEKLERNVGWSAANYNDAHIAAVISGVGFVRFTDEKDHKTYDLSYLGGDPQYDKAFEKKLLMIRGWLYINGNLLIKIFQRRFVLDDLAMRCSMQRVTSYW